MMIGIREANCVLGPCLDTFISNPLGAASIAISLLISIFSIYMIFRNDSLRSKIRWTYPMVFSLVFLITFFAFSMMCHESLPFCTDHAIMYSIPAAVLGALLFAYVILPNIYLAMNKAVRSRELGARLPSDVPVYIADSGRPFAFSYGGFRRWIVVSQGMIDILSPKELDAVLLHEYGHIESNSSFYKSSGWLYSKMPLLHAFFDTPALEDEEERRADGFAARMQGTRRHLNSAKRKLDGYFRCLA